MIKQLLIAGAMGAAVMAGIEYLAGPAIRQAPSFATTRSSDYVEPIKPAAATPLTTEEQERADTLKTNIAAYLRFKGWKCERVYLGTEKETNRIGLRSFHIGCGSPAADPGSRTLRGYLVTIDEKKWLSAVNHRRFDKQDRARISSVPPPGVYRSSSTIRNDRSADPR